MERPWENRPEFLPSLVVYSVAFMVGKEKTVRIFRCIYYISLLTRKVIW